MPPASKKSFFISGSLRDPWKRPCRAPSRGGCSFVRFSHFIAQTQQMVLEGARQVFELGGPEELADYLRKLDELYRARHALVDRRGINLVDGRDQSDLVARAAPSPWPPVPHEGRIVLSRTSEDGAYRLLILIPPPFRPLEFLPYFLWILLVVVLLGYLLSMHMARPLRALRLAVERFGRGELSTRSGMDRRDEIGKLGRAFDHMAGQIETLLSAERRLLQDVSHELRSPLTRLGFCARAGADGSRSRDCAGPGAKGSQAAGRPRGRALAVDPRRGRSLRTRSRARLDRFVARRTGRRLYAGSRGQGCLARASG